MVSLTIIPLLLLPLPLILPSKTKQSLPEFYESLRELPRLPASPSPLTRLRYEIHKIYFQYLVTGPGYVLEPIERLFFDLFIIVLLGSMLWCAVWASPYVMRVVDGGMPRKSVEESFVVFGLRGAEEMDVWSANMSLSVRTVYATTFGAKSAVGNVTVTMMGV